MYTALQDVPYVQQPRYSTRIAEIDWIYGGEDKNWGLPKGKISLWSGPSGTGKSKSLIAMSRLMTLAGHKVVYFQNEVTLTDFRAWTGKKQLPPTFYGSEANTLDEQLDDIVKSRATIAIVDSVNQMKEFGGGHKKAINYIYERYREVTKRTGVHVIFVCQLDKQNMIKGGSELLFLADTSIDLGFHMIDKQPLAGHFTLGVGAKHRYGRQGPKFTTLWQHTNDGAICISKNRLEDAAWCDGHSLKLGGNLSFPGRIVDPVSGGTFFVPQRKFA